jgi:hypothetical protein
MRFSFFVLFACNVTVPLEAPSGQQAPRGVIRGTVVYQGPRPCSRAGKVLGSAVILVYTKANPPPPLGVANRPVNFTVVSGETLFQGQKRGNEVGSEVVCPDDKEQIAATAPYAISPLAAGEYVVTAFYERVGNFLPSFSTHNQPESGDILGGHLDVEASRAGASSFFPVLIGTRNTKDELSVPGAGYVAEGIQVNLFQRTPFARPIFHGASSSSPSPSETPENPQGDSAYVPLAVMTQDHHTLAFPQTATRASLDALQKSYVSLRLNYGPSAPEVGPAQELPFGFEISTGLSVLDGRAKAPENLSLASLWPSPSFARLRSDPDHRLDVQSLLRTNSPTIMLSGLTLLDDSMFANTQPGIPVAPVSKDHITVLVRPFALCLPSDGSAGVIVTPHRTGRTADTGGGVDRPLFDDRTLLDATRGLATEIRTACLPTGRYAISLTLPTGQSWTTPNESGSCALSEGSPLNGSCSVKARAVLASQGPTGVVEIVPPTTPEGRAFCEGPGRVIEACQGVQ